MSFGQFFSDRIWSYVSILIHIDIRVRKAEKRSNTGRSKFIITQEDFSHYKFHFLKGPHYGASLYIWLLQIFF